MKGVSIIICCYNSSKRLPTTLNTLLNLNVPPLTNWEVIVVNNNSTDTTSELAHTEQAKFKKINVNFLIIEETTPGLSFARKTGIENASYDILIFCDDDNHLDSDYINQTVQFLGKYRNVGIVGGKSIPIFEVQPPKYFFNTGITLGCRDLGNEIFISQLKGKVIEYPKFAPIGTGMVIRKEVGMLYSKLLESGNSIITDRKGEALSSGGDNEIVLMALKNEWELGYCPSLIVKHQIPASRLTVDYLSRLNYEATKSWVILLYKYKICPWLPILKWTIGLRKLKSYFFLKAWLNNENYIRWRGACGMFEGLSECKS